MNQIPKVTLGETGIETTRVGLGMAGWPQRREFSQVVEVLRTAFEIGIRHLDNAPKYASEDVIGKALREVDVPGDAVFTSKVCVYHDRELGIPYQSFSQTGVERSIERSLKLLGRDHLDIVYIHDPREVNLPSIFSDHGPLVTLKELKKQGIIRSIGMGTRNLPALLAAVSSGEFDLIQTFHRNTLLNRTAHDDLYPLAQAAGVAVLDSGPYGGYILATGPREGAQYSYKAATSEAMAAAGRLVDAAKRIGKSLPDLAVAYALRHPTVKTVTVGSGNPDHVRSWLDACAMELSEEEVQELLEAAGPSIDLRRFIFRKDPVVDFIR